MAVGMGTFAYLDYTSDCVYTRCIHFDCDSCN